MTPAEAAIDDAILSSVGPRFQKVAMVIGRAEKALARGVDFSATMTEQERSVALDALYEAIAARIRGLVEGGELEGAGNLHRWRPSEVRLPPKDAVQDAGKE